MNITMVFSAPKLLVLDATPEAVVATIEALKARYMELEGVQAMALLETQKGNRWMAMVMIQFPDGKVRTMTESFRSREESRAARRRLQAVVHEAIASLPAGATPPRYLGSWNFGIADSSKWMATVPQS